MSLHIDPSLIVHGVFAGLEPADPGRLEETEYWEDFNTRFFRSNGLDYKPDDSNVVAWLQAEDRAPFVLMAAELLPRLAALTDLSDIGLVILAHWLPDLHLGTSVTNFALHRLGLPEGFGFAISDRGRSAPLFALRALDRYLGNGQERALLMVMDQKHLLYRSKAVDLLDPVNSACLLVLEREGEEGFDFAGYDRTTAVAPGAIESEIRGICHSRGLERMRCTVVADPEVAASVSSDGPVLRQDARLLCSAPFAALASNVPDTDAMMALYEDGELSTVCLRRREGGS